MSVSQAEPYLAKLPSTLREDQSDPNAPTVVFPTAMVLDRTEESRLVDQAFKRIGEMERESGRDQVKTKSWWTQAIWNNDPETNTVTFMGERFLMECVYNQQLDWRPYALGGIYAKGQNVHFPRVFQIVRQMIAKANNYFFSTEPYFAVSPMPSPGANIEAADQANDFAQYKFNEAGVRTVLEQANELAFVRGEAIIKTRHYTKQIRYQTLANVAVEFPGGPALLAKDPLALDPANDYIFDTDRWIQVPNITDQQKAAITQQAITNNVPPDYSKDPATGQPFPTVVVLERSPNTSMPKPESLTPAGLPIFEKRNVWRTQIVKSGPEAVLAYSDDFLAPLTADNLQDADCIAHNYSIQPLDILQMYRDRLKAQGIDPVTGENTQELARVVSMLRSTPQSQTADGPLAGKARPELKESETYRSRRDEPGLNIWEVYLTMDVNGDGIDEEVFMLVDAQTRRPIIYDHLPNVQPDSKRPFHAVVINKVKGRWHGKGMCSILWQLQQFIDLMINRWVFSNSNAGSVVFWAAELTKEGESNKSLRLNVGETYRKKDPKMAAKDILEKVDLHEFKGEGLKELMETANQMITQMSGITSVNDAAVAGLDTTKLATGIKAMQRESADGFAPHLSSLEPGLTSAMKSLLSLLLWYSDSTEMYHVLQNGKQTPMQIETINIRTMKWMVEMELTRYKNESVIQENEAAKQTVQEFYSYPMQLQVILLPFFEAILKSYMIPNAKAYLVPTQLEQPMGAPQIKQGLPSPVGPQGDSD